MNIYIHLLNENKYLYLFTLNNEKSLLIKHNSCFESKNLILINEILSSIVLN